MGGSKEDIDPCGADHRGHKREPEQRRNGMSIITTDEARDTAKCRAMDSFGVELIVRERELIDA